MDMSNFTRAEIIDQINKLRAEIRTTKGSPTPNQQILTSLENELREWNDALALASPSPAQHHTVQADYTLMMRQQSLRDAMRDVPTFEPGTDVNRFITNINKIYAIHVRPDISNYPGLEGEFVRLAQQKLDPAIIQQMQDSKQNIATFDNLKTYLMAYHGSQMSTFQHLSRAWDLQRRDGERLTDFAGRLETTILEAATHIKEKFKTSNNGADITADGVFSLMGAMLMSEKVKAWTPNIYPHLVRNMDTHYTAVGIANDAQRYLDRGIKTDQTTDTENAFYSHNSVPKTSHDDSTKEPGYEDLKQQIDSLTKKINGMHYHPTHSRYQTPSNKNQRGGQNNSRGSNKNSKPIPVCLRYLNGRPCNFSPCRYRHPNRAHAANTVPVCEDNQPTFPHSEQDFFQGPDEM